MTYDEIASLLSRYNWQLECQSPLEIRSKDGEHFATNFAAEVVIEYFMLLDQSDNADEKIDMIERFKVETNEDGKQV